MSQKGQIGNIVKAGKTYECVYVTWQTKDPVNSWYVNAIVNGRIARCRLISLIDRRPHEVNNGLTIDAWTYSVIDPKTFHRIANGLIPIPARTI